ncbi:MAG TPA: hypothetical protein DHM42_06265 [Clostridiales bacterium]|jgi:hypothetical protein|nr:hypothetical protein [Clostridiales bacterium]
MKKSKMFYLILVISISISSIFLAFGDNIQNLLFDSGYDLGSELKSIYEKSNSSKNLNIVAYVNDIPVYEHEIIERIQINKAILNAMKAVDSSSSLSWGSNPFDFVYKEKFILNYAKTNGIRVSQEELEEYISIEKASRQSEEAKELFKRYIDGLGVTEEEFYSEFAPPLYKENIIKSKSREHIFKSAGMIEKDYKMKQKYLDKFYKENIKVIEVDKDFINKYSE